MKDPRRPQNDPDSFKYFFCKIFKGPLFPKRATGSNYFRGSIFFVTKPDETIGYNNRGLKLLLVMKKKTLSRVKLRHRCLLAEKKKSM